MILEGKIDTRTWFFTIFPHHKEKQEIVLTENFVNVCFEDGLSMTEEVETETARRLLRTGNYKDSSPLPWALRQSKIDTVNNRQTAYQKYFFFLELSPGYRRWTARVRYVLFHGIFKNTCEQIENSFKEFCAKFDSKFCCIRSMVWVLW